jgi:murein DD-endopeptidase MepM/ murein hydrolase activator NlpD
MRARLLFAPALLLVAAPAPGLAQERATSSSARPVARVFAVSPATLQPGAPTTFMWRVDGPARRVRVRIDIVRPGERRPAKRLRLGYKRTRRTYRRTWTPKAGELQPGDYTATLYAVDRRGRRLRRSARASGQSPVAVPAPLAVGAGVFPLAGPFTFGEGFGAPRGNRMHMGQDLLAAEGTPVLTPRAGGVFWRSYQAGGAGNYLVVRADDGRDYVFMHLRDGSLLVNRGQPVAAGQPIAQVGQTGRATAPHLHFEIWPDGWYSSRASQPIDPLPDLKAWGGIP